MGIKKKFAKINERLNTPYFRIITCLLVLISAYYSIAKIHIMIFLPVFAIILFVLLGNLGEIRKQRGWI